jgi:hypothetical protein
VVAVDSYLELVRASPEQAMEISRQDLSSGALCWRFLADSLCCSH